MRIAFVVTDAQDIFLYSHLIELYKEKSHKVLIYFDASSRKTTSISRNKKIIDQFDVPTVKYHSAKECLKKTSGNELDVVITNEGMPFRNGMKVPFMFIALSWTIEHCVHGSRFLNMCDYFFCDDEIVKSFAKLSKYKTKVLYDSHPKYYCLHNKTKEQVCKMLGLPPNQKYVTVLGPAPALHSQRRIKDIRKIVDYFIDQGYKIVYKRKPKDRDIKICNCHYSMAHNHKKYSTAVLLSYLSDFVIGFNTSGIIESVHIGTPFINFFLRHKKVNYKKHPQSKINTNKVLRVHSFDRQIMKAFVSSFQGCDKRRQYAIATELDL